MFNNILKSKRAHVLGNNEKIICEIVQADECVSCYYDYGNKVHKNTYENLPAISASYDIYDQSIVIKDFVVQDSNQDIEKHILSDFIDYAKAEQVTAIHAVVSPNESMDRLLELYENIGSASFVEENGFINVKITL